MGHTGLWKSPGILEISSQGLCLHRMGQTRGGIWGPYSFLHPCPRAIPGSWASTLCQGICG